MAIVTQAAFTTLRNLKYGDDQPGGGNSGEPYITQPIPPAFDQQVASTNIWNSDNGLIRGGKYTKKARKGGKTKKIYKGGFVYKANKKRRSISTSSKMSASSRKRSFPSSH